MQARRPRRGRAKGGARLTDSVHSLQPNTVQCFINRKDCKYRLAERRRWSWEPRPPGPSPSQTSQPGRAGPGLDPGWGRRRPLSLSLIIFPSWRFLVCKKKRKELTTQNTSEKKVRGTLLTSSQSLPASPPLLLHLRPSVAQCPYIHTHVYTYTYMGTYIHVYTSHLTTAMFCAKNLK